MWFLRITVSQLIFFSVINWWTGIDRMTSDSGRSSWRPRDIVKTITVTEDNCVCVCVNSFHHTCGIWVTGRWRTEASQYQDQLVVLKGTGRSLYVKWTCSPEWYPSNTMFPSLEIESDQWKSTPRTGVQGNIPLIQTGSTVPFTSLSGFASRPRRSVWSYTPLCVTQSE